MLVMAFSFTTSNRFASGFPGCAEAGSAVKHSTNNVALIIFVIVYFYNSSLNNYIRVVLKISFRQFVAY
jgi:hypothetical protein